MNSDTTRMRNGKPFVFSNQKTGVGLDDIVVVAEPDAILVCHRDASQAVKTLVDGLMRDGRSIASGRDRGNGPHKVLTANATTHFEQWILKVGENVELPAGVIQVLDGQVEGLAAPSPGVAKSVQATTAANLLATSRPYGSTTARNLSPAT